MHYLEDYEAYKKWQATRRQIGIHDVKELEDGKFLCCIRNYDHEIRLGDYFGLAKILKLEAYQRQMDFISPGMTGYVTFSRFPLMEVSEDHPEWIERQREKENS